jgi:hypothetical protein
VYAWSQHKEHDGNAEQTTAIQPADSQEEKARRCRSACVEYEWSLEMRTREGARAYREQVHGERADDQNGDEERRTRYAARVNGANEEVSTRQKQHSERW